MAGVSVKTDGKVLPAYQKISIEGVSTATIYLTAHTNFVSYKDVSNRTKPRINRFFNNVKRLEFTDVKSAHIKDYQKLYNRFQINFGDKGNFDTPTNDRIYDFWKNPDDPQFIAMYVQYARYLMISSSRPGGQPANLQGIWNDQLYPPWDSKWTVNINAEMNYWPASSGNLSECFEPLVTMVKELTDQGAQVAKAHYGARGWVFHQNTDLWRVAAPMDGPCWGTFTVGGAWLTNQLYDHYLYTQDEQYLQEIYPLMKGAVQFLLDFLVEDPKGKWLVTNPSTSPES